MLYKNHVRVATSALLTILHSQWKILTFSPLRYSIFKGLLFRLKGCYLKAQRNARKILKQHIATLLERVARCFEKAGQTCATSFNIQKCCKKNFNTFKLDPTWPNVCNTLRVTMLPDVALKCCLRLSGPFRYLKMNVNTIV